MFASSTSDTLLGHLESLEKGTTIADLASLVPESLEPQAHVTIWKAGDPDELTMLRLLPQTTVKERTHKVDRVTDYGYASDDGFFGETSVPVETDPTYGQLTFDVKLLGEMGSVHLLASLVDTVGVDGKKGAVNQRPALMRLNLARKMNRSIFRSDTATQKDGTSGLKFKGLGQLIREGTDGTMGVASPYGSHVFDLQREYLDPSTLRSRISETFDLFGNANLLVMSQRVRSRFEETLDSAYRLNLPTGMNPLKIGQRVAGLDTGGGNMHFLTERVLSPTYYQGKYNTTRPRTGGPTGLPTVSVAVGAPVGTSYWDAADAGSDIFWVVTEVVNGIESLGTRYPSGSGIQAVTAGQGAMLTLTPNNVNAESFKIYRGGGANTGNANTDAWFIKEVANSGGGAAFTWEDLNADRPNTATVFGLRINSLASRALTDAPISKLMADPEEFFNQPEDAGGVLSYGKLGPFMGVMDLAKLVVTPYRQVMYSAGMPICRNAHQCFVIKNVRVD